MNKKKRKIFDLSLPWGRNLPTFAMSLSFYNPPMIATYSHFGETMFEQDRMEAAEPFFDTLLTFFSHTGTHFDAPRHCSKEAWSVDQVPLDRLWGEGVVVDMPKGELEEITPDDLENATPEIQEGDVVILNTGWHKNFCGPITDWDKAVYYANKNPGLSKGGTDWLIKKKVKVVGVDFLGVDHPKHWDSGDGTWPVHRGLLSNNIPMLQALGGDIDRVSGKRCMIVCAPVKYVKGDGFPVRVLAMLEEE